VGKSARVLAWVLAGGEGKRLAPLTRHIAKPAIPFHTDHRLIDFALSNLRNSGIRAIHVLMQYKPQSLLQHLISTWRGHRLDPDDFVSPITGGVDGMTRFAGTADAVYRNRHAILAFRPDVVAIFSADHVYRMDVRQMIAFHLDSSADATVAALPVSLAEAQSFGVIDAGAGGRIRRFAEKPANPSPMPDRPDHALASMGNYLFSPQVLLEALESTHDAGGTDFGGNLLPSLVSSHRLMAYDFTTNLIEGLQAECDPHYWRDVGTIDAYFAAHMDTLAESGRPARFEVAARCWPIHAVAPAFDPAAKNRSPARLQRAAAVARSAEVEQSILRQGACLGEGAIVSRCILGDEVRVGAGCRLRNVIVESDNHLPDGFEAGFDLARDRAALPVSPGGIVVIPRGYFASIGAQAVSPMAPALAGAASSPLRRREPATATPLQMAPSVGA
jgi:glucose-1-phosphate adenylyltransferase